MNGDQECVDFYISPALVLNYDFKNFLHITSDTKFIVPDKFDPFDQVNSDVYFCTTNKSCVTLFKADSDQDRPGMSAVQNTTN